MKARGLLVGLTTTPERWQQFQHLKKALDSIVAQQDFVSLDFFRVVLLHSFECPDTSVFSSLTIRMYHVAREDGPATKYTGLVEYVRKFPVPEDILVMVCDDDVVFRRDMLYKTFLQMHQRGYNTQTPVIWTHQPYRHPFATCFETILQGFAGSFFPKRFFIELGDHLEQYPFLLDNKACFHVDDDWISGVAHRMGYALIGIGLDLEEDIWDRDETERHPEWRELSVHTDRPFHQKECMSYLCSRQF